MFSFDAAGTRGHDRDAIAHVDGFINIMRDQEHRRAAVFPTDATPHPACMRMRVKASSAPRGSSSKRTLG